MADAPQNFKVDPDNFLSFEYDEYRNACYSLAISEPKAYYTLRNDVLGGVKRAALTKLYATFYDVLSKGSYTDKAGNAVLIETTVGVAPKYPNQKSSDFALDACATLMPVIEKVLDILLPMHGTETAQKRLAEVALGK